MDFVIVAVAADPAVWSPDSVDIYALNYVNYYESGFPYDPKMQYSFDYYCYDCHDCLGHPNCHPHHDDYVDWLSRYDYSNPDALPNDA